MIKKKKIAFNYGLALMLIFLVTSCNGTKHLKDGQQLYTGHEIKFDPPEKVIGNNKLEVELGKKLKPKPNKKFLGIFHVRVSAYLKIEPKKDKGFKYWLRNKIGKPPVLIQDFDLVQKEKTLAKAMQDNGYFHTTVNAEIVEKPKNKKAAKIVYTINNTGPTYIDSFILPTDNGGLDSIFNNYNDYQVKSGDIYSLENIQLDRINLSNTIRSNGYYDFSKNDLLYVVDTSITKNYPMRLLVKKKDSTNHHQKYYIRNVTIYSSFDEKKDSFWRAGAYPTTEFASLRKRAKGKDKTKYKFFDIREHHRFITRKVVSENVFIEPDDLFSIENYQLTSGRLVNLGLYKFVNIEYDKVGTDSLDVTIKLVPTKHQHFKTSVELSSSTLGYLGSSFNISYNNRNTSKKAINLTFKAGIGTEFQFSSGKAELNVLDANFGLSFSVPRRLRFQSEKWKSNLPPSTTFSINENFQKWIQYYTINDLNLEYKYSWQRKTIETKRNRPQITQELTPVNFSWLYLINTTNEFDELLADNSQLRSSFENNFIIGSKYSLTVNTKKNVKQRNYWLLSNNFESSGNLAFLLGKIARPKQSSQFEIIGVPFSQFLQAEFDFKNYWDINSKTKLIARVNTGIGLTYGNRETLPYSRQYFMGGPNTVRGFLIRNIGPGSYASDNLDNNNNSVEQTGDLKLLFNLEYRWSIYKFIKAAAFVDAGNVWLLRDDPSRPGGVFNGKDFIKELGLASGLGLRLDFTFIAIRLDLGFPLYKPYEEDGKKWFHQTGASNFQEWRKSNNWVWNFAIGYPF